MSNNTVVFVVSHKPFLPPLDPVYIPIQVGYGESLGFLRDNQQENISEKNTTFCELTALYFIWKNIDVPNVGLVHYRRYFQVRNQNWQRLRYTILRWQGKALCGRFRIATKQDFETLLQHYDWIIPEAYHLGTHSVREHYAAYHKIQDWVCVKQLVAEMSPEYLSDFEIVEHSFDIHTYNMFVSKKKWLDEYCEWLFPILFALERHIDITEYDMYNKRVIGFIAERLFNVWLNHHKTRFKIKTLSVIMTEKGNKL